MHTLRSSLSRRGCTQDSSNVLLGIAALSCPPQKLLCGLSGTKLVKLFARLWRFLLRVFLPGQVACPGRVPPKPHGNCPRPLPSHPVQGSSRFLSVGLVSISAQKLCPFTVRGGTRLSSRVYVVPHTLLHPSRKEFWPTPRYAHSRLLFKTLPRSSLDPPKT